MSEIIGRVLTSDGAPINGAIVLFVGDSPAHDDIAAVTNDAGEFRFAGLAPGHYELLVNSEWHGLRRVVVTVGRDESIPLVVQFD